MKKNKLYLILVIIMISFFILISLLIGCHKNSTLGNLEIKQIDNHTLVVNWSISGVQYAAHLEGAGQGISLGNGSGSGTWAVDGLQSSTSYTFRITNVPHGEVLATVTGYTSAK